MTTSLDVVRAARSFVGTPFAHQQRTPGVGMDCIGLLVCTARALGIEHHDWQAYGRNPNGRTLVEKLSLSLDRVDVASLAVGDVACFWMLSPRLPQHVGIVSDVGLIHTWAATLANGKHATRMGQGGRVVEVAFGDDMRARLHSAWRWRGLD